MGTVVNRALPSLHGGSLEIMFTVLSTACNMKLRIFKYLNKREKRYFVEHIRFILKKTRGFKKSDIESHEKLNGIIFIHRETVYKL